MRRLLPLLVLLLSGGCAAHKVMLNGDHVDASAAQTAFPAGLADLALAYAELTAPVDRVNVSAVVWLREKPEELAELERLARSVADGAPPQEAAAAWLLLGNAWLYVADNGRRIRPPRYTDVQAAAVWDEVVSRHIDPRFEDLEQGAIERLERCITLAGGKGRYAESARQTLAAIEGRHGFGHPEQSSTRGLPLLVNAID